jgi:hypothetical protein
MTTTPNPFAVNALALAFADVLARDMSATDWRAMRIRNRTVDAGVCASHDVLDANMSMHEAFGDVVGHFPDLDNGPTEQADFALWNAAWDVAKREHLTSIPGDDWTTKGERFDAWRATGDDVAHLRLFEAEIGTVENDNGGRIYNPGFVEFVADGAGAAVYVACGNQDILTGSLIVAERFLWDQYVALELPHA